MTVSVPMPKRPGAGARDYIVPVLSGFLVVLGAAFPPLTIACFLMNVAYIFFAKPAAVYMLLFFMVPFAQVYKVLSVTSVSLFTVLELLVVVLYFFKMRRVSWRFLILLIAWAVYILLGSVSDPMEWVKQILFPLLVYLFFNYHRPAFKDIIICLSLGLLVSSAFAVFREQIPNLSGMLRQSRLWGVEGVVYRFAGLYGDPNYYSQVVILSVMSLLGLYACRKMNWTALAMSAVLVLFGVETASKSFLLLLAAVMVFFLLMLVQNNRKGEAILVLLAGVAVVLLIAVGKIEIFNTMLRRLRTGDLTTGRLVIWKRYMTYFGENILRLLFGSGLGAGYYHGMAAHNSYIDLVYYFGLCGTAILAVAVSHGVQLQKEKRVLMNYAPLLCMMAANMFLSCVLFFDFPFNIILVLHGLQENFREPDVPTLQERRG